MIRTLSANRNHLGVLGKFGFLAGLLFLVAIASLLLGSKWYGVGDILDLFSGRGDPLVATILFELRLPRIILGILVGFALGTAGAAYQALFRNPLADPFVVGASSGAAVGATIVIISGWTANAFGMGPSAFGAFLGALGAVLLVYLIAVGGRMPPAAHLLTGTVVSTMLGATVWLMLAFADTQLHRIVGWLMGGLAGRGWDVVLVALIPVGIGSLILTFLGRPLDAMCSGEDMARGLGLPVEWIVAIVLAAASLSVATAVAASGIIGFVGLVAPHLARSFVGAGHAILIPASGLIGAILLLVSDALARSLLPPLEIPIGVVTAFLGGPFFLFLLYRRSRAMSEGW